MRPAEVIANFNQKISVSSSGVKQTFGRNKALVRVRCLQRMKYDDNRPGSVRRQGGDNLRVASRPDQISVL